ncbi:MAG: hypothetical protein JWR55_918 [Aeromicrobium sp.]|nr:hypothetical protein [Aeromicrobium sp.]
MNHREGGRAFACTTGLGAAWGWLAATSLLSIGAETDEFIGSLAIGLVYGGTVGALTGMLIGMPVAIVVGRLRPRLPHWRAAGTLLAVGMAVVVLVLFAVDNGSEFSWSAIYTVGPLLAVVGGSAWFGLGWIFAPPDADPGDVIPSEAPAPRFR